MNPITASADEFERYIQEKLVSSRKRPPSFTPEVNKSIGRASIIQPKQSNEFLQAEGYKIERQSFTNNVSKYKVGNKSMSKTTDSNPPPEISPKILEISHSWRGHLVKPTTNESFAVKLPSASTTDLPAQPTSSSRYNSQQESDNKHQQYHQTVRSFSAAIIPPTIPEEKDDLPYLPHSPAARSAMSGRPSASVARSSASAARAASYDPIEMKLRYHCLRRVFGHWLQYLQSLQLAERARRGRRVEKMHSELLLLSYLSNWNNLYRAKIFHEHQRYRSKMRRFFTRYHQRHHCQRKAIMYFRRSRLKAAWLACKQLLQTRRRRLQKLAWQGQAQRYRRAHLLQWSISQWKKASRYAKQQRQLEVGHQERQGKIQSFLQRLEQRPSGPSSQVQGRDHSSTTVASRQQAHLQSQPRSGSSSSARPSSRLRSRQQHLLQQQSIPLPVDHQQQRLIQEMNALAVDAALPPSPTRRHSNKQLKNSYSSRSAQQQQQQQSKEKQAAAAALDILPPPPSYRQFTQQREDDHTPSPTNCEAFPIQPSQPVMMTAHPGLLDPSLTRKDRINLLRQQANARIQEKRQQEQAVKEKEKTQKEIDELAQLAWETKVKKEEQTLKQQQQRIHLEHHRQQLQIAESFHRRSLLIRHGFTPWIRYLHYRQRQAEKSITYHALCLLDRYWHHLLAYYQAHKTHRIRKDYQQSILATAHHRRSLLQRIFYHWQLHRKLLKARGKAVTGHFSRFTLPKRSWQAWRIAFARSQRDHVHRLYTTIIPRGNQIIKRYYWQVWKKYLKMRSEEREVEVRTEMKWQMVQGWLQPRK